VRRNAKQMHDGDPGGRESTGVDRSSELARRERLRAGDEVGVDRGLESLVLPDSSQPPIRRCACSCTPSFRQPIASP
jgi:hypothetical protein